MSLDYQIRKLKNRLILINNMATWETKEVKEFKLGATPFKLLENKDRIDEASTRKQLLTLDNTSFFGGNGA